MIIIAKMKALAEQKSGTGKFGYTFLNGRQTKDELMRDTTITQCWVNKQLPLKFGQSVNVEGNLTASVGENKQTKDYLKVYNIILDDGEVIEVLTEEQEIAEKEARAVARAAEKEAEKEKAKDTK